MYCRWTFQTEAIHFGLFRLVKVGTVLRNANAF